MPHRAQIAVILGTLLCWVMTANLESAEPKKKRREIAVTAAEAPAEPALTEVKPEDLSAEAIEAKLKQLESATNLDPVVKKSLVDTYTEALNHLKAAQEHAQREAGFRKATIEAPRELQRVKARLDAHRDDPSVPATTDMGLSELQEALDTAEAKYEALQKRLDDLQEEPNRRAERRKEIPELQREAQRLVEELEAQIEPVRASTETARDPVTAAENLRKIAQREALERELRVYEEELRNYETTSDLIEAKRDHAVMQVELAEKEMKAWREALNERRRIDADRESKAAIEAAKNASPALRRLAEENATLAAERQELVAKIEIAYKEVDALQEQVEVLDTLYRKIRTRVDRIGLTESIGVLLRKQRESLPNIAEHIRYIEERKADMAKLNLQQVELEDKRAELAEIDERIEKILAETHTNRKSRKGPSETEIRTILLASREYLDAQIKDMNTYEDVLEKLNNTEADLVRKATDFSVFIREYILWIKSSNPPGLDDAREFGTACGWLLSPTHWGAVASRLNSDLRNHSTKYLGLIALLVALGYSQRVWRKLLRTAGRDAADHHTTSVLSTCVAFFSTFMLSVISPGLMWLIGWRLGQTAGRNVFGIAMAHALQGGAFFLATIN
ncbi:MAG: hypothetical protein JSS02_16850, partial [Planctomycetes bacterium]|nr:hypothetical protein [Planctomycetota bacterium]